MPVKKQIRFLLMPIIYMCIHYCADAQPEYSVQPSVKKYTIINNPLIKKTKQVDALIVNGEAYLEGDISLGKVIELDRIQLAMQGMKTQSLILDDNFSSVRWDNGIVPFVIVNGFTDAEKQIIISAMNHISDKTNVCFQHRTNQTNYIKFKKYTEDSLGFRGGSSRLGKCSSCSEGQEIKLSVANDRVVRHEICHALGLAHEQTREDRNTFVQILSANIKAGFENQFDQFINATSDAGSYDFNSIMHYGSTAFGKVVGGVAQQTIKRLSNPADNSFGKANSLSAGDIQGINGIYTSQQPCTPLAILAQGELEIGQAKTFTISAKELYNSTGVFMRKDQKFQLTTSSPDWKNGDKSTDCEGYDATILDIARRHGDIKMMALVGEIFNENNTSSYTGTYFKIGCSKTWAATRTGFLICIANDNVIAYGDNSGSVSLTVKRIE